MEENLDHIDNPTISVILTVYNGGNFLSAAVDSILNQTFKDFEFIIINDGSRDNSSAVLNKYANLDKRIILIERENRGLVSSLNEGLTLAKGKYIARMDSDDISLPLRFEKQVQILEEKTADICGCHFKIVSEINKTYNVFLAPISKEAIAATLLITPPFAHGSVMYRSEFIRKNNLLYPNVGAEDHLMWCNFFSNSAKFVTVDEILFNYRVHFNSISINKEHKMKTEVKKNGFNLLKQNKDLFKKILLDLKQQQKSEFEEQLLLLAAFKYSVIFFDALFFKCIKNVSSKTLVISCVKILTGKF